MLEQGRSVQVDQGLLAGWPGARSIARGLPRPVAENRGWRVETGAPSERRRYVFSAPSPHVSVLARSITTPDIAIKLCADGQQLLGLVPRAWRLLPPAYLMAQPGMVESDIVVPAGYRLEMSSIAGAQMARRLTADGTLAASGYSVEHGGVHRHGCRAPKAGPWAPHHGRVGFHPHRHPLPARAGRNGGRARVVCQLGLDRAVCVLNGLSR